MSHRQKLKSDPDEQSQLLRSMYQSPGDIEQALLHQQLVESTRRYGNRTLGVVNPANTKVPVSTTPPNVDFNKLPETARTKPKAPKFMLATDRRAQDRLGPEPEQSATDEPTVMMPDEFIHSEAAWRVLVRAETVLDVNTMKLNKEAEKKNAHLSGPTYDLQTLLNEDDDDEAASAAEVASRSEEMKMNYQLQQQQQPHIQPQAHSSLPISEPVVTTRTGRTGRSAAKKRVVVNTQQPSQNNKENVPTRVNGVVVRQASPYNHNLSQLQQAGRSVSGGHYSSSSTNPETPRHVNQTPPLSASTIASPSAIMPLFGGASAPGTPVAVNSKSVAKATNVAPVGSLNFPSNSPTLTSVSRFPPTNDGNQIDANPSSHPLSSSDAARPSTSSAANTPTLRYSAFSPGHYRPSDMPLDSSHALVFKGTQSTSPIAAAANIAARPQTRERQLLVVDSNASSSTANHSNSPVKAPLPFSPAVTFDAEAAKAPNSPEKRFREHERNELYGGQFGRFSPRSQTGASMYSPPPLALGDSNGTPASGNHDDLLREIAHLRASVAALEGRNRELEQQLGSAAATKPPAHSRAASLTRSASPIAGVDDEKEKLESVNRALSRQRLSVARARASMGEEKLKVLQEAAQLQKEKEELQKEKQTFEVERRRSLSVSPAVPLDSPNSGDMEPSAPLSSRPPIPRRRSSLTTLDVPDGSSEANAAVLRALAKQNEKLKAHRRSLTEETKKLQNEVVQTRQEKGELERRLSATPPPVVLPPVASAQANLNAPQQSPPGSSPTAFSPSGYSASPGISPSGSTPTSTGGMPPLVPRPPSLSRPGSIGNLSELSADEKGEAVLRTINRQSIELKRERRSLNAERLKLMNDAVALEASKKEMEEKSKELEKKLSRPASPSPDVPVVASEDQERAAALQRASLAQLNRMKSQRASARASLNGQTSQLMSLTLENERLKAELAEAKNKATPAPAAAAPDTTTAEKQVKEIQALKEQLNSEHASLNALKTSNKDLQSSLIDSQSKISTLQADLQRASDHSSYTQTISVLEAQIQTLQNSMKHVQEEQVRVREQEKSLHARDTVLMDKLSDLERAAQALNERETALTKREETATANRINIDKEIADLRASAAATIAEERRVHLETLRQEELNSRANLVASSQAFHASNSNNWNLERERLLKLFEEDCENEKAKLALEHHFQISKERAELKVAMVNFEKERKAFEENRRKYERSGVSIGQFNAGMTGNNSPLGVNSSLTPGGMPRGSVMGGHSPKVSEKEMERAAHEATLAHQASTAESLKNLTRAIDNGFAAIHTKARDGSEEPEEPLLSPPRAAAAANTRPLTPNKPTASAPGTPTAAPSAATATAAQ